MKMAVFQWFRCFVGSPHLGPLPGLLLASCWPLAGFLLASCWLAAASCWPLAGLLLASSFPTRISLENRFLGKLAKTVNSLHENGCFSMVSVFRGVPPIWGLFLASCWPLAGLLLASCWHLAGVLLACCWLLAGLLLASSWPLAGFLLASSVPTRISLENRFLGRLAKTVNSLHENGCFSMVSVFRGVPPIEGLFLASCWPLVGVLLALAGFLLASWPLAGFLLPLAGLLLASSWPLAGLFLASCWLLAGFKLPHEDFSRKSVFGKARENGEFSS